MFEVRIWDEEVFISMVRKNYEKKIRVFFVVRKE